MNPIQYFFAAAFYADCEHELFPVRGGMRLVLLYNLVRKGKKNAPRLAVEGPYSIEHILSLNLITKIPMYPYMKMVF